MPFTVPQFIEKEAKIIGPFTFKQFIFIGIAGGLCLFLYFTVSLTVFIILAVGLLGSAFALAFLKIGKTPLPVVIKNFFVFLAGPKMYLWRRKASSPKILKKIEKPKEVSKTKEKSVLKVTQGSKLKELATKLDSKKQ